MGVVLWAWFIYRGMRSGTVPHTLVVGLGSACEVAQQEMEVSKFIVLEFLIFTLRCFVVRQGENKSFI